MKAGELVKVLIGSLDCVKKTYLSGFQKL